MANFVDLSTSVNFYNELFSLFIQYVNYFDLSYHTIKYEDVVNDFDKTTGNLLKFLNLKYENKIKNYYITAKN